MLMINARDEIGSLGLVIHDMQNDHVNGIEERERLALVGNHKRLIEAARGVGVPVFYTGHWLRSDHFDAGLTAPSRRSGTLVAGTDGPEIVSELRPAATDYVIRKGGGMSAFAGTILDLLLRRHRIDTLLIAGVSTHVGVESTIRSAIDRDYRCYVASDACRSRAVENHEASLLNIGTTFGDVVTTSQAVEFLLPER
jgi:nicotinamidase-related amidase